MGLVGPSNTRVYHKHGARSAGRWDKLPPLMWVAISLFAGLCQSVRNALARSLSGKASPALISWARFAFNLPFSTALLGWLYLWQGLLQLSSRFLLFCLASALAQLLGNVCLIASFRRANFAQAILLHKLEVVFTAIVGAVLFSEIPSTLGWTGIVLTAAGVVLMQLGRDRETRLRLGHFDMGSVLAVLAGVFLVFTSFLLKEANNELVQWNPQVGTGRFAVAAHTLFHVTWMEVLLLTSWLRLRSPQELRLVERHWRRMSGIGFAGFLGSLGWFWAFSLTLVAYVKAVGQVESVVAVGLSIWLWKEKEVFGQLPGMFLVIFGILLVLLG